MAASRMLSNPSSPPGTVPRYADVVSLAQLAASIMATFAATLGAIWILLVLAF